ncbi:hypothetical protein K458DRAFT_145489 [Lentithecium fluviatile CBS 122367]|uniref:Uncharacterized protein n=1 Tax=Lentithecium fluviatile CBS 122367 TaxID=1168545 RepID=A0A6G1II38_9PLEO|nr:hypothetical protein K458DRAFT_145489 [Lentithecium fluviatile CBS 122367]
MQNQQDSPSNCLGSSPPVQANPDIAGIGVVLSFVVCTGLCLVVAMAIAIIDRLAGIVEFYRRCTGNSVRWFFDETAPWWRSPVFWRTVLAHTLLGILNSQLIIGVSTQITSLVKRNGTSVYHFRVLTELAYLGVIAQLATLVTLRDFFVKNARVNMFRVVVMVLNLALFGYAMWIQYAVDTLNDVDGYRVACFLSSLPLTKASIFRRVVVLGAAITAHFSVFLSMYALESQEVPHWERPRTKLALLRRHGVPLLEYILTLAYAIYGLVIGVNILKGIQAFGSPSIPVIGAENEWGFGQISPMLMLLGVGLPGFEAFRKEHHQYRKNQARRQEEAILL